MSAASGGDGVSLVSVGSRVVRGPDWQWQDQDGGPGHVGTVTVLGRLQHDQCPPGTVKVTWDHGVSQNYRVGYSGQYDLRLQDPGPSGVRHEGVACSSCSALPVTGLLWRCREVPTVSLCSRCYHNNCHDTHHTFTRHCGPDDPGTPVTARAGEAAAELLGCFPGAVVARGPDWRFGDQDGGPGARGVVREVHDWSPAAGAQGQPTARGVVSVVWANREDNMYCRGHKGQVHVAAITPARGGKVYLGHLPILGYKYELLTPAKKFQVGQHVMVAVDIETLKQMQVGHGGWHAGMMEAVGRRGRVHRITERGLVRVQYPGNPPQSHRWAINPAALRIVAGLNLGDTVRISSDRSKVGRYQNPAALESVLGCRGVVKLVHSDTSVVIDCGEGKVATIHPGCIELPREVDDRQTVNAGCVKAAVRGDHAQVEAYLTGSHAGSCDQLVIIPDTCALVTCLHHAACRGHANVVLVLMKYRSSLVNERQEDKTALQVAAHEGHTQVVDWLLTHGADPQLADRAGDTALHYAVLGARSEPILALVNKGAEVDTVNNEKRTALHLAVLNRKPDIVATLVKVGADVNIPDSVGDTAAQLAVVQGDHAVLDLLLPAAALLAANGHGHNLLHIAALKGDVAAVEKILRQDGSVVNIVTRGGQAALHLAMQWPGVVASIIRCRQCDLNIQDGQGRAPLHYAAARLDTSTVTSLVEAGAGVNTQDMLGNTPGHVLLSEGVSVSAGDSLYTNSMEGVLARPQLDTVRGLNISQVEQVQTVLLLFLFQRGARDSANYYGQTVLDLIESEDMRRMVREMVTRGEAGAGEPEYAEIPETAQEATEEEEEKGDTVEGAAPPASTPDTGGDMTESWRQKLEALEEKIECQICFERPKAVAFIPCGHQTCELCAGKVTECYWCRIPIRELLNLY